MADHAVAPESCPAYRATEASERFFASLASQLSRTDILYPAGSPRTLAECQPFMGEPAARVALLEHLRQNRGTHRTRRDAVLAFATCSRSVDDLFHLASTVQTSEPNRAVYLIALIEMLRMLANSGLASAARPEDPAGWLVGTRDQLATLITDRGAAALASNLVGLPVERYVEGSP